MRVYSFLTGVDDDAFCHRVTERLSRGWSLHGSPTMTYDAEKRRVICGQAVVKDVEGLEYSPDMKLGKQ